MRRFRVLINGSTEGIIKLLTTWHISPRGMVGVLVSEVHGREWEVQRRLQRWNRSLQFCKGDAEVRAKLGRFLARNPSVLETHLFIDFESKSWSPTRVLAILFCLWLVMRTIFVFFSLGPVWSFVTNQDSTIVPQPRIVYKYNHGTVLSAIGRKRKMLAMFYKVQIKWIQNRG